MASGTCGEGPPQALPGGGPGRGETVSESAPYSRRVQACATRQGLVGRRELIVRRWPEPPIRPGDKCDEQTDTDSRNDATCGRGYRFRVSYLLCGRGRGRSVEVIVASPAPTDQSNSADRIRLVLDSLVSERQALRHLGNDPAALEANRLAIVYWQQELSKRLIEASVRSSRVH